METPKDIRGKKFGKLTVIGDTHERNEKGYVFWKCRCDCGTVKMVSQKSMVLGQTKTCGCSRAEAMKKAWETKSKKYDITGKRFGRLVVLEYIGRNKNSHTVWKCKCDCGKIVEVARTELISGDTKSCGCYRLEQIAKSNREKKTTHGLCNSRIYVIWKNMICRCEKQYDDRYDKYGGKGVKVCDEWHDLTKFAKWAYANGYDENAPKWQCTIDRIDVDGDYCPENCRWVDMFEQNCNRTITFKVEIDGEMVPLMKACRENGVPYNPMYERIKIKGMTFDEALKEVAS